MFVRHCGVGYGTVVIGVSGYYGGSVFGGILCYHWVRAGTVAFVRYHSIEVVTVVIGVPRCGFAFFVSVWLGGPRLIMAGD